jgi:hypothetical protein
MNFINLATTDNLTSAEHLGARLGEEGIPTRVHDERDMQKFALLTKPKGYSKVLVQEEDYGRAAAKIQDWESRDSELASHIFSCPECGSFAVEYPQFTRKAFLTPMIIEWMSNVGLFEKQFYCRKCHAVWPPAPPSPHPKRGTAASVLAPPAE